MSLLEIYFLGEMYIYLARSSVLFAFEIGICIAQSN